MAPENLKKNQAILWARDLLGREQECIIVGCDTDENSTPSKTGNVVLLSSIGGDRVDLTYREFFSDSNQQMLRDKLCGRNAIVAGLDDEFKSALTLKLGVVEVNELMDGYRGFLGKDIKVPPSSSASNLAKWALESLRTIASTSLALDQADTGATRWTSAHFKVNPSMMDKLKSMIQH